MIGRGWAGSSSWVPFVLLEERAFAMVANDVPLVVEGKTSHFQDLWDEAKGDICTAGRLELSKLAFTLPILPGRVF